MGFRRICAPASISYEIISLVEERMRTSEAHGGFKRIIGRATIGQTIMEREPGQSMAKLSCLSYHLDISTGTGVSISDG